METDAYKEMRQLNENKGKMTESEYTTKLEGLKDRFSLRGLRPSGPGEVIQPRDNLFIENMRNPISSSSDLQPALRTGVAASFNTGLSSASRAVGEVGEIGTGLARGGTTASEAVTTGEAVSSGVRAGGTAAEAAEAAPIAAEAAEGARAGVTAAEVIRDIALAIELMPK
jgi:hypothetical protein